MEEEHAAHLLLRDKTFFSCGVESTIGWIAWVAHVYGEKGYHVIISVEILSRGKLCDMTLHRDFRVESLYAGWIWSIDFVDFGFGVGANCVGHALVDMTLHMDLE